MLNSVSEDSLKLTESCVQLKVTNYDNLYYTNRWIHGVPSGLGSSISIVTDYGLDGLGSNPGGDEIFRPSRPALGPTQPPVK